MSNDEFNESEEPTAPGRRNGSAGADEPRTHPAVVEAINTAVSDAFLSDSLGNLIASLERALQASTRARELVIAGRSNPVVLDELGDEYADLGAISTGVARALKTKAREGSK